MGGQMRDQMRDQMRGKHKKDAKTRSKDKKGPETASGNQKTTSSKKKIKLSEHTAFKNKDKKKKSGRQAVWVKKFTLSYEEELHKLQIELLKMQKHVRNEGMRLLMLFEGRDAAGKGGTIKRIIEHLNPPGHAYRRPFDAQ